MFKRHRVSLALLLALAALVPGRALEWKKTQIAAAAERGAEVVRTRFEFKNASKSAVHILGVTTSCGCTEATPTSSEIGPGERGALDVLFTIGKRTGLQEKEITVLTDDSNVPTRLKLTITLPAAGAPIAVTPK
jgi:hypothetical protein